MEPSGVDSSVRVSVVMPTLNEAANLPHVLPRLPAGCTRCWRPSSLQSVTGYRRKRPELVAMLSDDLAPETG